MRALIVHYHLKPGGVTTVIRRQLSALALAGIDAAVLSGEAAPGFGGTVSVEPALGYEPPGAGDAPDPERVAAITAAIRLEADALGPDTVIHVHNPAIRKNASLPAALSALAASGRRVVAHVHDLAEDWRPDVYSRQPYPEGVCWAAINRFDAEALRAAGAGSAAFLPNPVPCPRLPDGPRAARGRPRGALVLCPVRGIRRKNLGETVLLSLFMRPGGRVGVTLPPSSPKDVPYYGAWRETAERLGAPVTFGMGLDHGLDELYARALAVLTTSVKEGFGMSFLEPAARGIPTTGRRLARVVPDFEAEGLSFPALYDALAVPRGLFDEDAFRRRVGTVVEAALAAFGRRAPGFAASVAGSVLDAGGQGPDFGRLDETAQAEALSALASSRRARSAFLALNPFVEGWDETAAALVPPDPDALSPWSEAAYGERLASLYRAALESGGGAAPDKEKLLDIYLSPEAFHGVGV